MAVHRNYYVNDQAQPTGEHEVHHSECSFLPSAKNMRFVGAYTSAREAVSKARLHYVNVDGCKHCIPDCHTR